MSKFQEGFWGISKRNMPWKDIIRSIILEIGNRPDLPETVYHKLIHGKLMTQLPASRRLVRSIVRTQDEEFGLRAIEKFYQLPASDMPAPDTVARMTREAKSELTSEGKLNRNTNPANDNISFEELMVEAEERTANVYSGLEARFLAKIRTRFRNYVWDENKKLSITQGPFAGQTRTPDILCERLTLAIEIDSLEFHLDRTSFTQDRQKMRILQYLGYYVLQFSGPELAMNYGISNALNEIQFFIDSVASR